MKDYESPPVVEFESWSSASHSSFDWATKYNTYVKLNAENVQ